MSTLKRSEPEKHQSAVRKDAFADKGEGGVQIFWTYVLEAPNIIISSRSLLSFSLLSKHEAALPLASQPNHLSVVFTPQFHEAALKMQFRYSMSSQTQCGCINQLSHVGSAVMEAAIKLTYPQSERVERKEAGVPSPAGRRQRAWLNSSCCSL